jgi:hypothetical protein
LDKVPRRSIPPYKYRLWIHQRWDKAPRRSIPPYKYRLWIHQRWDKVPRRSIPLPTKTGCGYTRGGIMCLEEVYLSLQKQAVDIPEVG